MDNRMERINEEIKLAKELIAMELLTNEFYQTNSTNRNGVLDYIERNLGVRYREERLYLDASRVYNSKKHSSKQIAPLERQLQQLQTDALLGTMEGGKVRDEEDHARIQKQIQVIQRQLQRARDETQGIDLGALEQAAGAAFRALEAKPTAQELNC